MTSALRVATLGMLAACAAGCTDLKPLQAQVDSLKSQVTKLTSDAASHAASDDAAHRANVAATTSASRAAAAAQATADQALSAAQRAQSSVDATNEKIDRMFKRSVSK